MRGSVVELLLGGYLIVMERQHSRIVDMLLRAET